MPYSKSQSRKEFEKSLNNLGELVRKVSYKSNRLPYSYKNLIYQSSIFLLSASIEEYIKRLIEDWIYQLKSQGALNKNISDETRSFFLADNLTITFKKQLYQTDEKELVKDIHIKKNFYSLINDNDLIYPWISASSILKNKKYPKPDNLITLFHRLGIQNIFHHIDKRGNKDYKALVRSFLDVRESIAHQSPPALTYSDVLRHFINIQEFISHIDRTLYSHIIKTSGPEFWTN
jgi:hypothetical protein